MRKIILEMIRKIGAKVLIYTIDISKSKIKEILDYVKRVETFHKKIKQEMEEFGYVSDKTNNCLRKYECDNMLEMVEAIKNGRSVSNIKREMVIRYVDLEMNIRGRAVGLTIELLLFLM